MKHFEAVAMTVKTMAVYGKAAYIAAKEADEDPTGARRIGQQIVAMLDEAEQDIDRMSASNADYNLVESAKSFFEYMYQEFNEKNLW